MITILLKEWKLVLLALSLIALFIFISLWNGAKKEVTRQTSNVSVLNSNYKSYKSAYNTGLKTITGKDSIINLNAAKVQSLTYTVGEYKEYSITDAQTIKDLKLSLKTAQSASGIETQTITNTVIQLKDSCFNQNTEWQDISGCIKKGNISIKTTNRDSLFIVISTISKHNFLFFHWGDKINSLTAVSKNPNTNITGLKYTIIKH
jgi:hypothetical protein